jgi:hypothetical protein
MVKDCPQPKRERGFGGGFRGGRGGSNRDGGNMGAGRGLRNDFSSRSEQQSEAGWGSVQQSNSPKQEGPSWGASAADVSMNPVP